jgi:HlyD family secretion protein
MATTDTHKALRRYQWAGFCGLALLAGGLGTWAALAAIQGAVIAPGVIAVETYLKRIQHRDGGIVAAIAVKEGDRVEADQVLVKLDETDSRTDLSIVEATLDEFHAKQARLLAERDDLGEIEFPSELTSRGADKRIADILAGQRRLFTTQRAALKGRIEQLTERIGQLEQEVVGLSAQYASKKEQTRLVREELDNLKLLLKQGLIQANRVFALDRERADLEGAEGELYAQIASTRGRISEVRLQVIQLDDDASTKSLSDLREAEAAIAEAEQRRIAARAKLERTVIRAPRPGYVHQLAVHTIGGVISPGADIMAIVPDLDQLVIDVHVRPEDIDQVTIGQTAKLRFPAFDQRTTPEVMGEVMQVDADLTTPTDQRPPYYGVRVHLQPMQDKVLGTNKLKPGMPAEAFIQTKERTPFSYLLQPLTDQIAHTFREG